ncbi:hypothetical protein Vretimale_8544 [Volvox reticuliferus]|uniref:EF-hand domain-containing protein n=1 Tax=Volvox reticuliferus TaxID=1737510 RepID=A0A8J4CJE5_9CHLO|nr:hypothetical protein Vretifemale_11844 [Volvox reticuliferus]GIM03869.1 hypothetical protein Vretimale_8544 [Volvox reticuliferus]
MDIREVERTVCDAFNAASAGEPYLNRHSFKCAVLAATGWKPRSQDLEACLGQQVGANAILTIDHLQRVVQMVLSTRDSTARLREVYEAFDTAGLGFIRREEALHIFKNVAPTVRTNIVEEAFDALDTRRTGRVSCEDFMAELKGRIS